MKITPNKKIWFIFSSVIVIASIFALSIWGLKPSIDFQGGSLMELSFKGEVPKTDEIYGIFKQLEIEQPLVQSSGKQDIVLRFASVEEGDHQAILDAFTAKYSGVEEARFDSIGPAVGAELFKKSLVAVIMVTIIVMAYIAWSFRKVGRTVPSWIYGSVVIITFLHDVIIPLGVFAWLGHFMNVEVGGPFIAAALMILGYSINDTIVVLDRVRENLRKVKGTFEEIVEASVHQTINRSINTSFTTLLALIAVLIFGGSTLETFALALIIGIIFGTYSSIFIAPPLLVVWNKRKGRK